MKVSPLFTLIALVIFSSCTKYTQFYETKPTSTVKIEKENYVFENDTVKITFSFWADRGKLSYTIFNKLNIPIYIDWKKSSFVKNGEKLDYWVDEATTISSDLYVYSYYYNMGTRKGKQTTVKPERVVFIAPASGMVKANFYIIGISGLNLKSASTTKLENPVNRKKQISAKRIDFTIDNSPLIFRNFITISTSDKFDKETYIDNGFFVSTAYEMNSKYFGTTKSYQGKWSFKSPFESPTRFYLDLSKKR